MAKEGLNEKPKAGGLNPPLINKLLLKEEIIKPPFINEKAPYVYNVARTKVDRQKALALVKKVYRMENYLPPTETIEQALVFDRYILQPEAKVFTVFNGTKLFATISVVPDSVIGIPMDHNFNQELLQYRKDNKKIAEVMRLALDEEPISNLGLKSSGLSQRKKFEDLLPLLEKVISYGIYKSLDYLVIEINPKHSRFYEHYGFKQISEKKEISLSGSGKKVEAIAYVLDLKKLVHQENLPSALKDAISRAPEERLFADYN